MEALNLFEPLSEIPEVEWDCLFRYTMDELNI